MKIFFLQRDGINLYHTLIASETSRNALRFYHPKERPGGVTIPIDSLVSGLSIAGELRWYIRRYIQDVLFEFPDGNVCTLALTRQVYYDRETTPGEDWPFQRLYIFNHGRLVSAEPVTMLPSGENIIASSTDFSRFLVCCTEQEYNEPRVLTPEPDDNDEEEPS